MKPSIKKLFSFFLIFSLITSFFLSSTIKTASAQTYIKKAVLAQVDIYQSAFNRTTNTRGMHLGGTHVHQYSADKAMYVYDSGNNRILAYLNPDLTSNDLPEKVFGQNDSFDTSVCNGSDISELNPTNRTLCLNRGNFTISKEEEPRFSSMDTDTNGNFYVLDQYNNRILRFNNPFGSGDGEGDTTADYVWAQGDFNSKICNRSAGYPTFPSSSLTNNGICTSKNVAASIDQFLAGSVNLDNWGNLWVSDTVNNRVLRFPFDPASNMPAQTADIVIGQPDMASFINGYTSCGTITDGTALCSAYIASVNDADGELYIIHGALSGNPAYRITVYSPNTVENNPTSYSFSRQFGIGNLNIPRSIAFLDANTFLIGNVLAGQNDKILHFDKNGNLLHTITDAQITGATPDSPVNLVEMNGEISINGQYLFISENRNHNSVLIFDLSNLNSNGTLSFVGEMLGGTNYVWNNITNQSLGSPFGNAISKTSNQLFVSDGYRILVWNLNGGITTDKPADFVIGQPNFTSNKPNSIGNFVFKDKVAGLSVDENHNKLWVARNQEAYAFNLPITASDPTPSVNFVTRIPNSPYLGNISVKGLTDNLVFKAWSFAYNNSDDSLWLVDSFNSRVVRINNPYSAPQADLFVGQNDINGTQCNRNDLDKTHPTAQTLCNPSSAAFDSNFNLFIAEGVYEGRADRPGNKRIVEYDKSTIDASLAAGVFSEPAATRVYAVSDFNVNPIVGGTGGFTCIANSPCNPISISFDSQNRMAVLTDAYYNTQNHRVYVYNNPLRTTGYVAFDETQDRLIQESVGQGGFSAFDANDNLYIEDHTWNRIVYMEVGGKPTVPVYNSPANNSVNQLLDVDLSWQQSTDPEGEAVSYDVYLGESQDNLSLVSAGQSELSFSPTGLQTNKTYFWKVVAKDNSNDKSTGPIWSFSTYQVLSVPTNLAKNKTVLSYGVTGVPSSITDGSKYSEGTPSTVQPSAQLTNTSSYLTVDLGSKMTIRSVKLQADSNDSYRIQVSSNNSSWTSYGTINVVAGSGFTSRLISRKLNNIRYVRISPISGDGYYSVSEIEVN